MFGWIRSLKRKRLAKRPFPDDWRALVEALLPFSKRLEGEEHDRFLTHLKVFAWEKHWIGVKDVEVTDEMRVVISGSAARLSRNLSLDAYDRLTEVLIYPSHYQHAGKEDAVIYGEAHTWGTVVFSWDAVQRGIAVKDDGHDTALHEFAHVLDIADGGFDGTPDLHGFEDYEAWARVLTRYFDALKANPSGGVVREYGAQNEAEFFAVSTEAFFEQPRMLKREAPELYKELKRFYRSDPLSSDGGDIDSGRKRSLRRKKRK